MTTSAVRWIRVLLYAHALIAVGVSLAYLVGVQGFGQNGMDARKLSAFLAAFAVLLVLAARRLAGDDRWLWAVVAVVGLNGADSAYEVLGRGDANFVPPLVLEGTLLVAYVVGAVLLRRQMRPAAAAVARHTSA